MKVINPRKVLPPQIHAAIYIALASSLMTPSLAKADCHWENMNYSDLAEVCAITYVRLTTIKTVVLAGHSFTCTNGKWNKGKECLYTELDLQQGQDWIIENFKGQLLISKQLETGDSDK